MNSYYVSRIPCHFLNSVDEIDMICFPNYPEANPGTNMDIRTLKEDYMNTEGEKYVNSARIVSSATKLDKENLI
eukprot:bmy_05166T0